MDTASTPSDVRLPHTPPATENGNAVGVLRATPAVAEDAETDPVTTKAAPVSEDEEDILSNIRRKGNHWASLLTEMEQYDQRMIDGWKSELKNLLLFAGLFSAVVTAFTVASYAFLRPDPGESTVDLLRLISLQLSSFTLNSTDLRGFNYLNSTVQSTVPPESRNIPPFTAFPALVKANKLWFLSLTFALVDSFFVITVQQWLHRGPPPRGTNARDAVKLRQLRFDGLQKWEVPTIIAILPVIMQIALILFLVGLSYFLYFLDNDIGRTIVITLVVSIVVYTVATAAPVFTVTCPYKSAVIPIIWTLTSRLPAVIIFVVVAVLNLLLMFVAAIVVSCFIFFVKAVFPADLGLRSALRDYIITSLRDFRNVWSMIRTSALNGAWGVGWQGPHSHVNKEVYWSMREISELQNQDLGVALEGAALIWSVTTLPVDVGHSILARCSKDLKKSAKIALSLMRVVSDATHMGLRVFKRLTPQHSPLDPSQLAELGTETLKAYRDLMIRSFDSKSPTKHWDGALDDTNVVYSLLLLCDIEKKLSGSRLDAVSRLQYIDKVLAIQDAHGTKMTLGLEGTTQALYHLMVQDQPESQSAGYVGETDEVIHEMLIRATKFLESYIIVDSEQPVDYLRYAPPFASDGFFSKIPIETVRHCQEVIDYNYPQYRSVRICLYSVSTALYILSKRVLQPDNIFLGELSALLNTLHIAHRSVGWLVVPNPLESGLLILAESLARLVKANVLPIGEACPSPSVVEALWEQYRIWPGLLKAASAADLRRYEESLKTCRAQLPTVLIAGLRTWGVADDDDDSDQSVNVNRDLVVEAGQCEELREEIICTFSADDASVWVTFRNWGSAEDFANAWRDDFSGTEATLRPL